MGFGITQMRDGKSHLSPLDSLPVPTSIRRSVQRATFQPVTYMYQIRSVHELADRVSSDPVLAEAIREDPARAIASVAAPAIPDTWIYRIVVISLGLVVLVSAVGAIVLEFNGRSGTPEILVALGSAAVGALAGLLAPSPRGA